MPIRKQPPAITDAVHFDLQLKDTLTYSLDNGTKVYSIHAGTQDVISLEWVFYAGNWFEEKNLIAATTNYLLRNGTTTRNAFQINEYFEYYGSYLNRTCYNETAVITLHCLNKHVDRLLPVVRELITDSIMPQEELDIYCRNMKQHLKVNLKKNDFVASRLIDSYIYGESHPYGKYTIPDDYDNIDRNELLQFYDKYYRNGQLILFVAGRIPASLDSLLNRYFGDLPFRNVTIPEKTVNPAQEKKFRISNDENSVQGSIRIARPFPNRHHPDFLKAMVLNTLLGGFFGSRLMQNIREDKGYTYGINSFIQNHIHSTAWIISTEAGKEVCEATIQEVYKEMQRLRKELVTEEELALVKNYLMGKILGDLDGPFQIIARWKNIILHNLTKQYFYDTIHTIRTIPAPEIQQLAQKYLNPEDFYELVVV